MSALADGKLLAVSFRALHRYDATGMADPSLDGDGDRVHYLSADGTSRPQFVESVHSLNGGKILVGGISAASSQDFSVVLAKLNADGSFDTSFGAGAGKVFTNLVPGGSEHGLVTAVLPDGRILVAVGSYTDGTGLAGMRVVLARFLANGAIDTSFGTGGTVSIKGEWPGSMTIQPDGKVIIVGTIPRTSYGTDSSIHRFNADGSIDTTFGTNGHVQTDFVSQTFNPSGRALAVALQSDGKIVVAGSASLPNSTDGRISSAMAVARYDANGRLDTSFGTEGKVVHFVALDQGRATLPEKSIATNQASEIHIRADGTILLAGSTTIALTNSLDGRASAMAFMQLNPNGSLDTYFGYQGVATLAPPKHWKVELGDMVVKPDGSVILAARAWGFTDGAADNFIAGLKADGTPDYRVGSVVAEARNETLYRINHPDQFLNPLLQVSDPELKLAGNYSGASVTLARVGGANISDVFSAGAGLRFSNGRALLDGVDVATVSNENGMLKIVFSNAATEARVNKTLQSITYANSAALDGQSIIIEWVFNDNNTGAQGTGAALAATYNTLVTAALLPQPQPPTTIAFTKLDDGTVTLYGTAAAGAEIRILNGTLLVFTTVAGPAGSWEMPAAVLPDGLYDLLAVTVASASIKPVFSQPLRFLHDTKAPLVPSFTAEVLPGDGLGYLISGSAEANSSIELIVNHATMVSASTNSVGKWEVTLRLAAGNNTLYARAIDASGNLSPGTVNVYVDVRLDDFSDTVATTGRLLPDASASGTLEAKGDRDWFKITLEELVTYRFTLSGSQTGGGTLLWGENGYRDSSLRLWDPMANNGNGEFVYLNSLGAYTGDLSASYSVKRSGDYYIEAGSVSHSGSYTIKALTFARDEHHGERQLATPATVGTAATGALQTENDVDTFRYALEAGKTYTMILTPGAGLSSGSVSTQIGDQAQSMQAYGSTNGAGLHTVSFFARNSDVYFVSVSGGYSNVGSYSVSLMAAADDYLASTGTTGVLAIGSQLAAQTEVANDSDWFKLDLKANVSYTFRLTGGSSYDARLTLYDATGNYFYANSSVFNNGDLVIWTPSVSATYFIAATSSAAISYTLKAYISESDDHGSSSTGASPLTIGVRSTGRLEVPSDNDWFKVTLKADYAYTFTAATTGTEWSSNSSSPLTMSMINAAGGSPDGSLYANHGATVIFQPSRDGDYYLNLRSHSGMGNYSIESSISTKDVYPASNATTGSILPGAVLKSTIDFSGDVDFIKVELVAGEKYTFEVTGVNGQGGTLTTPYLRLRNDTGSTYEYAYGQGRGGDPLLSHTASKTGTYYLEVGANGGAGSYTLKAGNSLIGLADTFAPYLFSGIFPIHDGTPGPAGNLGFYFNEKVVVAGGTVRLTLADGTLVESFDLASSVRVSLDQYGTTLFVDPTLALNSRTEYKVQISAGAVKDLAGLLLADSSSFTFRTGDHTQDLTGTSGNDSFTNGRAADTFNGGAGLDTVFYPELGRSSYQIEAYKTELYVYASGSDGTTDRLTGIERIVFADQALAFDIGGMAGQVYRLYQAAFNRAPDKAGMGYWLSQVDRGVGLNDVAHAFVTSAEFIRAFGSGLSNAEYVKAVYGNVLHRLPDQAGLDYWVNALEKNFSRQDVLIQFSESSENQAAVIGQITNGISYLPYG